MNDGLKEKHRSAIRAILGANPRVEKAVLFGSRATGSFSPRSDVDIALFGHALSLTDQASLTAEMDALCMAQRVDLVRHHTIRNKELLDHIEKKGVVWFKRNEEPRPREDNEASDRREPEQVSGRTWETDERKGDQRP